MKTSTTKWFENVVLVRAMSEYKETLHTITKGYSKVSPKVIATITKGDTILIDTNTNKDISSASPSPAPLLKEKKELTDIQKFVEFYKEEFSKINDVPPIINYGKVGKLLNPYFKSLGVDRLKKLLLTYLDTDDPFYEKNGYSLDLFLSSSILHALNSNN
jgi:hypothetical protein